MRRSLYLVMFLCPLALHAGEKADKASDPATWSEQAKFKGQPGLFAGIGMSSRMTLAPKDDLLALTDTDTTITVLDASSGKVKHKFTGHRSRVVVMTFSGEDTLLSLESNGVLKTWDLAKGKEKSSRALGLVNIQHASFSKDGKKLATTAAALGMGGAGQIQVWDLASGAKKPAFLNAHSFGVDGVMFGADEKQLWTRGGTIAKPSGPMDSFTDLTVGEAKLWDVSKGVREAKRLSEPGILSLQPAPDGKHIGVIAYNKKDNSYYVKVLDIAVKPLKEMKVGPALATALAFAPDGKHLAAAVGSKGYDKAARIEIRVWEWKTGKLLTTLIGHSDDVDALRFSSDGSFLLSASRDGFIRKWAASAK